MRVPLRVLLLAPKGYPWAVNGAYGVFADSRSPTLKAKPKITMSSSGSPGNSDNQNNMLKSAGDLIASLNIPVLKDQWNNWKNKFQSDGKLLKFSVRLYNQQATIVIYRPKGKTKITDKVNVAVLVDNFKISNLIRATTNTVADDLRINKASYIFVPRDNEENINTNALPGIVRTQVEKVRTGPIVIVSGQNMFAIVNNADNGPTAKFLKQINIPLGNMKVNAAYGQKKLKAKNATVQYKGVRLTRTGRLDRPFHLRDTSLTDPTFKYLKVGNVKTFRGWGTAAVQSKPYFMFLQKQGNKGSWPTAAALDTRSMSMKDFVNVATIFSNTIFSGVSQYQNLISLTDKIPLDAVQIENPNYNRANAVDRDNNPVFTNMMLIAAGKGDVLPDGKGTKGSALIANGTGKVLGVSVGSINASIYGKSGTNLIVKARASLPNRGGMRLGTFDFDIYKSGSKFKMQLKGSSKVTFQGKTIVDQSVTMGVSKTKVTYSLGSSCPLRPAGTDISINNLKLNTGSSFKVKFHTSNIITCILAYPVITHTHYM